MIFEITSDEKEGMEMKKLGFFAAVLLLVGFALYGCSDVPSNYTVSSAEGVAGNPGVLYGKVIDAQTRTGISGAVVYIKAEGTWRSATTSGATTGGADNQAGDFVFSGLPVNSEMPIVIKPPQNTSYLQLASNVIIMTPRMYVDAPNNEVNLDMGLIPMQRGVTATIHVVDSETGAYVARSSGALAIYPGSGGIGSVTDVLAAQDATDLNKYTLAIAQNGTTDVTFPAQDVNGDGIADYQTATVTINPNGPGSGQYGLTTNIAVTRITNNTTLTKVSDNITAKGRTSFTLNFLPAGDPIKVLLNMPAEIASGSVARLQYQDDFRTLAAPAVTTQMLATAAMNADGTLLTLTSAATLTANQLYTVINAASVTLLAKNGVSNNTTDLQTVASLNNTVFTVPSSGAGTIGNSPVITVDNGNYCTNGIPIVAGDALAPSCPNGGNFGAPMLLFTEPVWGTVALISTTTGTTTARWYGPSADINITGCPWYSKITSNDARAPFNLDGYNREGALCAFDLNTGLVPYGPYVQYTPDSIAALAQQVTLELDVYDADGNTYHAINTYTVE